MPIMTYEKHAYRMDWKKFITDYLLWIVGVIISFLPLFIKHLVVYEAAEEYSLTRILTDAISDLDFYYLFVNTFIIWYLQCEFSVQNNHPLGIFCKRISGIVSFVLMIYYMLVSMLERFSEVVYKPYADSINLSFLLMLLLFGAVITFTLSIVKE